MDEYVIDGGESMFRGLFSKNKDPNMKKTSLFKKLFAKNRQDAYKVASIPEKPIEDKPVLYGPEDKRSLWRRVKHAFQEGNVIDVFSNANGSGCHTLRWIVLPCFGIAFVLVHIVFMYSMSEYFIRFKGWHSYEDKVSNAYSLTIIPVKDTTEYKVYKSINTMFYLMICMIFVATILIIVALAISFWIFTQSEKKALTGSCSIAPEDNIYLIGYFFIAFYFLIRLSLLSGYLMYTIAVNVRRASKKIAEFNAQVVSLISPQISFTNEGVTDFVIGDYFRKLPTNIDARTLGKAIFSASLYRYYRNLYRDVTDPKDVKNLNKSLEIFAIQTENPAVISAVFGTKQLSCFEYMNKGPYQIDLLYGKQWQVNYLSHIPPTTWNQAIQYLTKQDAKLRALHHECRVSLMPKLIESPILAIHFLMINFLPWVFYSLPLTLWIVQALKWVWSMLTGKK